MPISIIVCTLIVCTLFRYYFTTCPFTCSDIKQVNVEVLNEMKKKRKSEDYAMKDGKRYRGEGRTEGGTRGREGGRDRK